MKKLLILSLITPILSACATGTIISKDGKTDQPKWHKVEDVILNNDTIDLIDPVKFVL